MSLKLANLNLRGRISPAIGDLKKLQHLDLGKNYLTGDIPSALFQNELLQYIILRGNSLSGILSPDLCHLTALALFDVGSNHLTGTIPDNIGNCTNLKILDLSDNQITGVIPSTIILPQLSILMLEGNKLHGKIPEVIGLLQSLDFMDLSQNELVGTIPMLLGNLSNASAIHLHNNKLTGLIPPELGNMSALLYLELNNNQLVGGIPEELGRLGKLLQLNLANNYLEGPVPRTISSCTSLNIFNVHGNRLNGSVPSEFQNLKNLTRLNFSCNNFSGQIPNELGYTINLDTLDVSSNDFSGPIPSFVGLQHLLFLFLGNPLLCGPSFNPCGTHSHKSKGVSHTLVISVIVCPITILILCVVILTAYKANQPQRDQSDKTVKVQGPPQPELTVLNNEFSHYIYKEIMRNTENMNEKYIIGTGASGNVFKCESEGLRPIAIKQFKSRNDKSKIDRQAKTELEVLAHINHKNLIKLLGYSFSSTHGLLIFMRYMKNGSLYDALHGPPEKRCHLVWSTRQTIAVGAAQGLAYLHEHCKPRRIHRDIKSANVLLGENFEACIADFGLARCMADDQINIVTEPGGTRGYIAPECNQIVSEKFDVYSFGVLLLELITGMKALIGNGDNLLTWILSEGLTEETIMNVADPLVLLSCTNPSSVWKTYITACRCTHSRPSSRPPMSLVVAHLTSLLLNPDGQPDYNDISDE